MKTTPYLVGAVAIGIAVTAFFNPLAQIYKGSPNLEKDAMLQNAVLQSKPRQTDMEIRYNLDGLARDMAYIKSYIAKPPTKKTN